MLFGRSLERSRLDRLVADAKNARSRSLVLRGEAGIGKTALLDYATSIAGGMRLLRVVGIESEAEVGFAGLQLLFARDVERLETLPGPQSEALRAVFGTSTTPVDRLAVGGATLTLLSEIAGDGPVLCLLDDAQWFDRSSVDALLFAARRLHTDPIATIFAVRDGDRPFPAPGIDSITLSRLDRTEAARLVSATGTLPPEVAERILTESGGNPLAIVELAANANVAEAPQLPAPVAPLPATGRLEDHFRRQVRALDERTRTALLLAAADHGSLPSFTAAADQLGLHAADLEPAERSRLVQVTADGVVFRHPLIRAAAYQDAPLAQRLTIHRALADTLVDPRDADRRAWHVAAAADGIDDTAAAELERAAERAVGRGAPAAAARALERAAQLSGQRAVRGRRLVAAARAAYDAGLFDRADELAGAGAELAYAPGAVAEAGWVRAQVAYERSSPAQASRLALDAAEPILTTDPSLAISVLTEATMCARDAADLDLLRRCADQLRGVRDGSAVVVDGLIGFTDLLRGNVGAAVPPMHRMLLSARDGEAGVTLDLLTAGFAGLLIGADGIAVTMLEDLVADVRATGELGWLPYAQEPLALAQLLTGRLRDAEANVAEAAALAAELGQDQQVSVLTAISAWLAAARGDTVAVEREAALVLTDNKHRVAAAQANWARALCDLMAADPYAALDRLDGVCGGPAGRDLMVRAIPDHVEAAVRAGDRDRARRWMPRFVEWSTHTKSPTATALMLRCEALLDHGDEVPERFAASLAIDGCGPYDRARTQLAFGGWLRRHRRRSAARDQLTQAHEGFDQIAALGWQELVRAELVALGDVPADALKLVGGARLTPQELQVARRAAQGLSNREIAADLFLSPRTVGHHLYKAYPKLGVKRRTELARLDL